MITGTEDTITHVPNKGADPLHVMWRIAWRHISEGMHNRSNIIMTIFFIVFPVIMVLVTLLPIMKNYSSQEAGVVGSLLAVYLLMTGLMSSASATIVAANAFAGEKEQGSLAPLLATPASNGTIFAGKVLGAMLPTLAYAAISVIAYLIEVSLFFGIDKLALLPAGLTILMLLLVPATSLFGAVLVSVISSRVRTMQSAQQYGSLVQVLILFGLFAIAFKISDWGLWTLAAAVAGILIIDALLIVIGVSTWRREEVMAQR